MRNLNERNITEAVIARAGSQASPRVREVMASLTRHLHDFVREVRLTEEEWERGIAFLTETGHRCDDKRQEFILLSDVLGISMLCVALNHARTERATEATVFGPFHVPDAPMFANGDDISNGGCGDPCLVSGTVRGVNGEAVPFAQIDIWHADGSGAYDVQDAMSEFRCRGRIRSDEQGRFLFRTVKPVAYKIPDDGPVGKLLEQLDRHPWRPAHIHFKVDADGYETLITHVFENGDPYLDSDAVFGVRSSLIGDFRLNDKDIEADGMQAPFYSLQFDLVLDRRS
jgi:hydroxyquinol 1,2-dioxygenase